LYRSLSQYIIQKQWIPKFISCEPHQYLCSKMSKFAEKKTKSFCFLFGSTTLIKKGGCLSNQSRWISEMGGKLEQKHNLGRTGRVCFICLHVSDTCDMRETVITLCRGDLFANFSGKDQNWSIHYIRQNTQTSKRCGIYMALHIEQSTA
jgi:hypothetical protein